MGCGFTSRESPWGARRVWGSRPDAIRALTARTGFPTSHGRQRRDLLHVADAA